MKHISTETYKELQVENWNMNKYKYTLHFKFFNVSVGQEREME